jgi:radical SAM superfamily enzyme YgiQ (UPF0313 family)
MLPGDPGALGRASLFNENKADSPMVRATCARWRAWITAVISPTRTIPMPHGSDPCRVVLLNPPTAAPATEILLNLAYLSAALKHAGHEVLVLDATAPHQRLSEAAVERRIREFAPHFIGVTLTITYIVDTYGYLARLRLLGIPIVAGGPHANCLPEEVLAHGVDIVAVGEGEETIVELAEHFLGRKSLANINGLCFSNGTGDRAFTPPRPLIPDLDSIPFPDHDEFPIARYTGTDDPNSNPVFWSIFTSRGCPYQCTFCSSHNVFGRSYRARSPANVLVEIQELTQRFGPTFFAFQDDEAFIKEDRILEFCRLVRDSGLPLQFSARLRIDSISESMLAALKECGFRRLSFGVESLNDETLAKIRKQYNVETVQKGFRKIARTGFPAISFNQLIGFPWETAAHLDANLAELTRIPPEVNYFSFVVTPVPYPKTKLYEDHHEEYGFTDWWLDPRRNSRAAEPDSNGCFYMSYARSMHPLYTDDQFWHYSGRMKAAIERYSWQVLSAYLKRYLSRTEYLFVYHACRASHRISKLSPRLEQLLFHPLKRLGERLGLPQKVSFAHRR